MNKLDLPLADMIFYGVVTIIFVGIAMFGAFEGAFGSALYTFDGAPRPSALGYAALAACYGTLCSSVFSSPLISTLHMTIFVYSVSAKEGFQNLSDFSNIGVISRHLKSHRSNFRSPENAQRSNC